eukprot:562492-Alexandrium_andersonii.AAC.1
MCVPNTRCSGFVPRVCCLTACREHSQASPCVPHACRALRVAHARALSCVLKPRAALASGESCAP